MECADLCPWAPSRLLFIHAMGFTRRFNIEYGQEDSLHANAELLSASGNMLPALPRYVRTSRLR